MGVDLAARGLGPGLLVLLLASALYAWILVHWARRRPQQFFWPGLALGILGFLGISMTGQYLSAQSVGASLTEAAVRNLLVAVGPMMVLGPWFASRSVVRSVRRGDIASGGAVHYLKAIGGFWGGVGLALLFALVGDIARLMK